MQHDASLLREFISVEMQVLIQSI